MAAPIVDRSDGALPLLLIDSDDYATSRPSSAHMRSTRCIGLSLVAIAVSGCTTHRFLDRNVVRQSSTLTDLMYQQVLDNVAMFANNRSALPHLAVIGDGTTQAQDGGTLGANLAWNATTFTGASLPLNGSRQLIENWKLQPVMTAGRIRRLRCAFQLLYGAPMIAVEPSSPGKRARVVVPEGCVKCVYEFVQVGILPAPCPKPSSAPLCVKEDDKGQWEFDTDAQAQTYAAELQRAIECSFPTGWFCVGTKKDAPRRGCLTGKYCETYAWVAPGAEDALARFTMSVLALATLDPPPKPQALVLRLEKDATATRAASTDLLLFLGRMGATAREKTAQDPTKLQALREFEASPLFAGLSTSLQKVATAPDLGERDLLQLRLQAAQLRDVAERFHAIPPEQAIKLGQAAEAVVQRIDQLLAPAPTTTILVPESQDAFSRPGSMPLSRGSAGLEFAPAMPAP